MVSRGPWWQDGSATRPVGGYGAQAQGATDAANVTSIVQSWMDGAPNNGFTIQAGLSDSINVQASTSDGWSICTTGSPLVHTRPMLKASYTTVPVKKSVFQNGAGDYAGTTMAIVRSGTNALIADTGSLHSSFGAVNGLQVDDGDISGALSAPKGFIRGAEVWFDVTACLEAVRTGAADHGIAIQANGTADGWQIHATGSTTPDARPRLVVYSADLGN
jgi:hypothetical protein